MSQSHRLHSEKCVLSHCSPFSLDRKSGITVWIGENSRRKWLSIWIWSESNPSSDLASSSDASWSYQIEWGIVGDTFTGLLQIEWRQEVLLAHELPLRMPEEWRILHKLRSISDIMKPFSIQSVATREWKMISEKWQQFHDLPLSWLIFT